MSTLQFEALISRKKIDESILPIRLTKEIANTRKLRRAIEESETELKEPDLAPERKTKLETLLAESKPSLVEIDQEIVEKLEKWDRNKDRSRAQSDRMKQSNDRKRQPAAPVPSPAATPQPAPVPAPSPSPTNVPATVAEPEPTPKKKGISTGGWIAIALLSVITLGVGGMALSKRFGGTTPGL